MQHLKMKDNHMTSITNQNWIYKHNSRTFSTRGNMSLTIEGQSQTNDYDTRPYCLDLIVSKILSTITTFRLH
jgi:hypothetical protein